MSRNHEFVIFMLYLVLLIRCKQSFHLTISHGFDLIKVIMKVTGN